MSERSFSEVSLAYNRNIFLLNEARNLFETEMRRFNDVVIDCVKTSISKKNKDPLCNWKILWEAPEEKSTQKDGPWLNFNTKTEIGISIKIPNYKNFRRGASYLMYEVIFDWEKTNSFIFRCRFENQNVSGVGDNLDEKLLEISKIKNIFPESYHLKSNTCILFSKELNSELLENIGNYINDSLDLCCEMINATFPDSLYNSKSENETPSQIMSSGSGSGES